MNIKLKRAIFVLSSGFFLSIPIRHIRTLYLRFFVKEMGENVYVGKYIDVKCPENITIGSNVVINKRVLLDGRRGLKLGNNIDIAQEVAIWTEEHDHNENHTLRGGTVTIGDYCWLCHRSIVLPNVSIAKGCVVACSAVVTHSCDELAVVAGIPARIIGRSRNSCDYKLIYSPRFYDQT